MEGFQEITDFSIGNPVIADHIGGFLKGHRLSLLQKSFGQGSLHGEIRVSFSCPEADDHSVFLDGGDELKVFLELFIIRTLQQNLRFNFDVVACHKL